MAFLDESNATFEDALAEFLAAWTGPEDTDDLIAALRDAASDLEKSRADDA